MQIDSDNINALPNQNICHNRVQCLRGEDQMTACLVELGEQADSTRDGALHAGRDEGTERGAGERGNTTFEYIYIYMYIYIDIDLSVCI